MAKISRREVKTPHMPEARSRLLSPGLPFSLGRLWHRYAYVGEDIYGRCGGRVHVYIGEDIYGRYGRGQRVIVSYEEQDSCGFFNQVDYIGRVVSMDPFDGLLVKFDVADASGDVLWVDDSDEWAWAM